MFKKKTNFLNFYLLKPTFSELTRNKLWMVDSSNQRFNQI